MSTENPKNGPVRCEMYDRWMDEWEQQDRLDEELKELEAERVAALSVEEREAEYLEAGFRAIERYLHRHAAFQHWKENG